MAREIGEKEREENIRKSEHAQAELEKAREILGSDESGNGKWFHDTYMNCHVAWTTKGGEFDARCKFTFVFDANKTVAVARAIMDALAS